MPMQLTPAQEAFKQDYIRKRGYWVTFNDGLLQYSQAFLETYMKYAALPAAEGPLSPRMVELVYVAADASATHMFGEGLLIHTKLALARGASPTDVVETLQIATAEGLEGVTMGVEILVEELQAAGQDTGFLELALSAEQVALKAGYQARFGDWPRFADYLLRLHPSYFAVMTELVAAPEVTGSLSAKERCLIAVALNAAFTHQNPAGTRLHVARAIRAGATKEEILQVMQLTAHLGVHACVIGVPMLMKAVEAASA
ncbi:MAG: carboxymuconolactone decarboxylase family protein [Alphaproteobacteria bacterium]|nr:carboxymuconolactone decarboxylase family protein [Alphaproteobacteria bacterium]